MGSDRLKYILFGIFLILVGLMLLGVVSGGGLEIVAGICGLVAGILMLVYRSGYGYGYGYRRRRYWR